MGKTKTAFVGDTGEEKPKKSQKKKEEKVHIAGLKGGQRIKIIETETPQEEPNVEEKVDQKRHKKARVRGKRYIALKANIDRSKLYPLDQAVKLTKDSSYSKFDGTVELHLIVRKLGLSVNATLPHSTGKQKRVEIANEETIKGLETGKVSFDILLATAEMMPKLVPFAKLLGPKGLMPNPKNGTLIKSAKDAEKFSGNTLNLKTEKTAPVIHTAIGKVSQSEKEIAENAKAVIEALGGEKQILKAYMKPTMGPSVRFSV